ncbi:MAG: HEPN domain-containing protein [Phycisphaerae bacterium]|nr:HEPN domain-containing protein [Phycisphaerae bacterium]
MNEPPEHLQLLRQWVGKADEDLRTAEHILTLEEACPFSSVCFHAQQCVEKYLKALLLSHNTPFGRTHDLVRLYDLLAEQHRRLLDVEELAVLNRYAVEARYPGDWEPIDRKEAEFAVGLALRTRNDVRAVLSEELRLNE